MGTFTRAGTATYVDQSGTTQTAANDVPRWTYAPYGILGLLLEDATTTGTAADVMTETDMTSYNAQAGTFIARLQWQGAQSGVFQLGSNTDHLGLELNSNSARLEYMTSSAVTAQVSAGNFGQYQTVYVAARYSASGIAISVNGSAVVSQAVSFSLSPAQLLIGQLNGNWLNGPLHDLYYRNYAFTDSELRDASSGTALVDGLSVDLLTPLFTDLGQAADGLPQYEAP